ncbi:MAG: peptidoglycan DD-metalloendopeptidase family protein [Actinobacteria bacterium]|nr:peptidoglycan DD-metalloendopeptidase family protein [Actinomycetota bacterium]
MQWLRVRRALLMFALIFVWLLSTALPALSVTKAERDAACADSKAAQQLLEEARARANDAEDRYDAVNQELEQVALRVFQFRERIDDKTTLIGEIRGQVMDRAVEMYMNGGSPGTEAVLFATSVDAALTGQEFLSIITAEDVSSIDQLDALKRDLERTRSDWQAEQARLTLLDQKSAAAAEEMNSIMEDQAAASAELSTKCRAVDLKYRQEQARAAALAAARKKGAAGGVPASATPGFICPMDPATVHFRDTWGAPRSGGRTHKGTDIFAPKGQPVVAVADGTVRVYTNRLGGKSVWVYATYGIDFYYAHLSGWAAGLKTGDRVTKGQIVGYNGNSGNAYGGATHVHFQLHPGGGSPVNPYQTLKRACG